MNTVEFSLSEFCRQTRQAIPLLQSMDLRFTEFGDHRLRVDMPLAPNINDKQTGFGGSIAALATAAGWAIVSLMLKSRPHHHDVMVTESHMRYLAPATGNFYAIANISDSAMATFNQVLDQQRQGRITLQVMVEQNGKQVAFYTGTYKVVQRVSQ